MSFRTIAAFLCAVLLLLPILPVRAENPFLNGKEGQPSVAKFKGTEWNDEFDQGEYSWTAQVTTTRLATAPWGVFYKIAFSQISTKAPHPREMHPLYFLATDNEIVLINEEKPEEAIARFAKADHPPKFEPGDLYGLSKGTKKIPDGDVSTATLAVKGDRSSYQWTHSSGHFTTAIWQRGAGLVEYARGYGARKDGFRLTRVAATPKK